MNILAQTAVTACLFLCLGFAFVAFSGNDWRGDISQYIAVILVLGSSAALFIVCLLAIWL